MTKHVDEHLSFRGEPGAELVEELGVTFHVFEHFYGEDVGESVCGEGQGRARAEDGNRWLVSILACMKGG